MRYRPTGRVIRPTRRRERLTTMQMQEYPTQDDCEFPPKADDFVVGWDSNIAQWFLARVDDADYPVRDFPTYRDTMRALLEDYQGEACWHEQNGGGLLGEFDPHEELHSGWEGEDY